MPESTDAPRAHWKSRSGFILAAAGSAVGLGNIWKFPYISGENGGGAFVLVYLVCISLVGVPVLVAEIMMGRATQSSPANAFRSLGGRRSRWPWAGVLAVCGGFLLLSYYSVVAAWGMHFAYLSVVNSFAGNSVEAVQGMFGALAGNPALGSVWQLIFLALTVWVVSAGVTRGIERWSRIMVPSLIVLLLILLVNSMTLEGWGKSIDFLFGIRADSLTGAGVLEALGHAFFTLSLGMGSMLTYGSYLSAREDIPAASLATAGADTGIAVLASMMLFPIVFTFGLEPGAGPGLLFVTVPIALSQMTGGGILAVLFFVMVVFAALTSAISMFEVAVAYIREEFGRTRRRACVLAGLAVTAVGLPATLVGGWFDAADHLVSNWLLPISGLLVAIIVAWRMDGALRRGEFESGSRVARFYGAWLWVLKYPVPACIIVVFLNAVGVLGELGLQ